MYVNSTKKRNERANGRTKRNKTKQQNKQTKLQIVLCMYNEVTLYDIHRV